MAETCSLCQARREKRFCPAVHGRICAQCCGHEREVTLDCPSECPYLREARKHQKPRPLAASDDLFPAVEVTQHFVYEREPLLAGLSHALAEGAQSDRGLNDRDLIAALTALAKSYETLVSSGLHVAAAMGAAQQALAERLEQRLEEYRAAETQHQGFSRLRDADILAALVFLVRLTHSRTSGRPRSRAFIEFLQSQFPASGEKSGGRLVVP